MTNSHTPIPLQLQPTPFCISVLDGRDRLTYSRDFLRLLYTNTSNQPLPPDVEDWISQYQLPSNNLVLGDVETLLTRYSTSTQTALNNQIQQLLERLNSLYPLPEGEKLQSAQITITTQAWENCPAGTVVYIRQTNIATIQFLLSHIVVNLKTGQPSLVGMETLSPPQPKTLNDVALLGANLKSGIFDAALDISGSLVWALPHPWGAFGSAGLEVLRLLFGDSSSSISQAIEQGVQELETFLTQQKIQADAQRLKAFSDWLNLQIAAFNKVADKDGKIDNVYILDSGLLAELRRNIDPGGDNVYTAIYDLEVLIDDDDSLSAFGIYVLGVTLYLLGLKMILQFEALVASNYYDQENWDQSDKYNKLWLQDYNIFEIAIDGYQDKDGNFTPGWAKKVSDKINNFYTHRIAKITDVYRWEWHTIGPIYNPHYGWTWRDTQNNDDDFQNFVEDTTEGGCCSHTVEHKDQAETNRQNWINTVSGQLDTKYQNAKESVKKWTASIYEWNEHLPPMAPTSSPSIDSKGWQGKPPQDPNWKFGNRVAYAVQFKNDSGTSPLSNYSQSVDINPETGATVINIPIDDSKMATHVLIYRCITTAQNQQFTKLLAGPKIGTTTYQDIGH